MDVLNVIINSDVSIDQIFEWLTTDDPQNVNFSNILPTDTTRTEFVLYFLNYLRKQCQSIVHVGGNDVSEGQLKNNACSTPSKQNDRILEESHDKFKNDNIKYSPKFRSNNTPEVQMFNANNLHNNEQHVLEEKLANTSITDQNILNELTSTPLKGNIHNSNFSDHKTIAPYYNYTPGILYLSKNDVNPMIQGNFNILNQSPQSSPIMKYENNRSMSFNQSRNSTNFTDSFNSFPELSNSFQHMRNVSINDSIMSNTSMSSNSVPCSPISPMHAVNMEPRYCDKVNILTPKHKGSYFQNKDSPVHNHGSGHKNKRVDHNRSFCLGDFLTVDTKNKSSANESLSPSIQKSKSKRRIKPTKLIVSNNTENQQQQVFGVVNRPAIINPQFTESQPKDMGAETSSFEVERGLLKIERQKQPKFDGTENISISQEPISHNKPKSCLINIEPKLELVENIEILNILAALYSGLLRKNLIPNLMTELYFVISLITSQYKSRNNEKQSKDEVESSKSDDSILQDSLDQLKENLGCRDLNDDISEKENIKIFNRTIDSLVSEFNESKQEDEMKNTLEVIPENLLYLEVAHNCVYFATTVLAKEKKLLAILDRTTLKLLSENSMIISFKPELQKYLNELYSNKCLQSKQLKPYNESALQTNVCFQLDTDNQENFSSLTAFSTFRKQRDSFYEILKIWEDNHLSSNWSFHTVLQRQINTMLSMHNDTVNLYHIARLFKSQLLMSSIESKQMDQPANDESLSILKDVKHINPDKLKQLKERLITPVTSSSMNPVPPVTFPGVQEFYQDFILTCSNSKFYVILEHCFIQEIMELNDAQFVCSDIEAKVSEIAVDESTKQNYLLSISSLRLMAKFLGLIVSIPYRSDINSIDLINTQITLRSRILPSIDLHGCLCDALKYGKLSLTVPWMVQYLSMLDSVSFRLPYYLKLCEMLYCIYRVAQSFLYQKTALLLTFSIGWLFELPNFPKDLYHNWYSSYNSKKMQIIIEANNEKNASTTKLIIESSKNLFNEQHLILDKMEIVDDRVLYTCCPFLKVFRGLLTTGNSNVNSNSGANRHITPVSSQLSQPLSATKSMTLQLQLEEAFFHGQAKSFKRTVDFVSERVASSCVKYICQHVIPKVKDENFKAWKKILHNNQIQRKSPTAGEKVDQVALIGKAIKEQCDEQIKKMATTKTANAMESLLADDILPAVKDMSIKIAQRMAMERINRWIDSYINNAISSNSMYRECLNKKHEENIDETELEDVATNIDMKGRIHNPKAPCSTSVINALRNSLWELIEQAGRWTFLLEMQVLLNIQNLKATLHERTDTVPIAEKVLYTMSVDYALHIIVFKMELMTENVENDFMELWKLCSNVEPYFSGLLSPRNIKLFMQSKDRSAWPRYGRFIGRLLIENILNWEVFSEECVAVLRFEWPVEVLRLIPTCLMETLNYFKSTNEHTAKIKYMIEWIAETCSDLNS